MAGVHNYFSSGTLLNKSISAVKSDSANNVPDTLWSSVFVHVGLTELQKLHRF